MCKELIVHQAIAKSYLCFVFVSLKQYLDYVECREPFGSKKVDED